jgi:hypothetical protein
LAAAALLGVDHSCWRVACWKSQRRSATFKKTPVTFRAFGDDLGV